MADQSDRQSPIYETSDEETKTIIKEFIKKILDEIEKYDFFVNGVVGL